MARRRQSAGNDSTEKKDKARRQSLKPLRSLGPYLGRYKGYVIMTLVALTLASLATLAVPMAVRRVIDLGFSGSDTNFVDRYFGMLILVVAVLALASSMRYYFVNWLGERVVSDLRKDVFAHLATLSPSFYDKTQSGEVMSRLTADTTQIKLAVGASASVALRNLFLFVGAVVMMVITSPKLSGLVLAAIPFIVLPLVGFGRSVRVRSRKAQDTLADASAYANEIVGAVRSLQAFTNEGFATRRFHGAIERAFSAAQHSMFARALLTAVAIFMVFASVVAVLWYGAQDVLSGELSPGALGQFVLYAVFAAGALGDLSQVGAELAQASGAAERLSELLSIKPDITAPDKPVALAKPVRGGVEFDHVAFAYPSRNDTRVLHEIALSIAPGQTVAIVGPSGSGKSTLFHMLMRYYDPCAGQVMLDGVDLKTMDPQDFRSAISIVPQETVIFADSAMENIRFGRPDASDADVVAAAKAAHAHDFLENMAEGYQTKLGERGVTLSGGQRQRIAIARAILKDAPVLLLDEATSALDAESETVVQDALDGLMKGRTTLVIAHRLATVLEADQIVVMDNGRIVETGTHDSLVKEGGLYARLARLQFDVEPSPIMA